MAKDDEKDKKIEKIIKEEGNKVEPKPGGLEKIGDKIDKKKGT